MAEPVRVFHLIKGLGRGGAEVLLDELLRVSDPEAFTYGYGYFLPFKSAMVSGLEAKGGSVHCFDAASVPAILASVGRVTRHLRVWQPDVVHCHLPIAAVVGRIAARRLGLPVVYTEHNQMERHHVLTRRLNLLTWGMQERAIAVSEGVAASIRKYGGERVPVEVVPNAINTERYHPDAVPAAEVKAVRRGLGIPETAPVVGTVGVFTSQKRLDLWLDAAKQILEQRPDAHFLIVGDGPLRADLEAHAFSLGIAERVRFVGLQEDVRPFILAMDVFVMASEFEGFGLVLVEAMALRRPVVATAVGGVLNVVEDGENGILTQFGHIEALAGAALDVLSDDRRRAALVEAGRRTAEKQFSIRRMSADLEAIYRDVLALP